MSTNEAPYATTMTYTVENRMSSLVRLTATRYFGYDGDGLQRWETPTLSSVKTTIAWDGGDYYGAENGSTLKRYYVVDGRMLGQTFTDGTRSDFLCDAHSDESEHCFRVESERRFRLKANTLGTDRRVASG